MMLTLSQAAEAVGISRSGLLKAIKRGHVSAVRDDVRGQWIIDSAELFRAYPRQSAPETEPSPTEAVLAERVQVLERLVASLEDDRRDLRRRLDDESAERRRLTALLTHQAGTKNDDGPRTSLLDKLFRRGEPPKRNEK